MHRLVLVSTLLLGGVEWASAADMVVSEPAPSYDWTGFYAGGQAGIGWGDADYHFPYAFDDGPFSNFYNEFAGDAFSHRMSGGLIGAHAGYNQQFGNLVAGIEAAISLAGIGKSGIASPFWPESDRFATRVEWFGTLTPRLGYTVEKWLFYGKGGLAYGQVRSRVETLDGIETFGNHVTERFRRAGWTAGAGVDYALTDNIILGIDYNFVDLGSHTISRFAVANGTGSLATFGSTHSVDTAFHAITARVSWKFN